MKQEEIRQLFQWLLVLFLPLSLFSILSTLPIKRFVSCNSFCKRRTCSANCSWLGRASLILMLLYVATPIGVLMPLNDHWTLILSISEQTSKPIVGFSSSVSFRYYLNMMPPRHQRKRQWKISTNLVEFFGTQFCTNLVHFCKILIFNSLHFCTNLVQNFFLSLSIKQMLFCLGGFANSL